MFAASECRCAQRYDAVTDFIPARRSDLRAALFAIYPLSVTADALREAAAVKQLALSATTFTHRDQSGLRLVGDNEKQPPAPQPSCFIAQGPVPSDFASFQRNSPVDAGSPSNLATLSSAAPPDKAISSPPEERPEAAQDLCGAPPVAVVEMDTAEDGSTAPIGDAETPATEDPTETESPSVAMSVEEALALYISSNAAAENSLSLFAIAAKHNVSLDKLRSLLNQ